MDDSACLFSILNKPRHEKIDLLIGQPIESLITTLDILKGVVSLIFDYAVLEPTFCPMFAQLCSDLKRKLGPFPSGEPGGKDITFLQVLLNTCQQAFEGLDRLKKEIKLVINAPKKESARIDNESIEDERIVKHRVSVLLIGELYKLKMVPAKIVHRIVLEKSTTFIEIYNHDKNMRRDESTLTQPLWFRKKPLVKQTIPHPRVASFTIARYDTPVHTGGGFTPVRSEEYFWYPVDYEIAVRSQSKPLTEVDLSLVNHTADEVKRITITLLNEHFSVLILDDVLQFLQEPKSPHDYPEFVKEAIFLLMDRSRPCVAPIAKLLDYLLLKQILVKTNLRTGCRRYASMLDDIAWNEINLAPNDFGEVMGHLVLCGVIDFKVIGEVIDTMKDYYFRKAVFDGVLRIVRSSSSGNAVLTAQADDIAACEEL